MYTNADLIKKAKNILKKYAYTPPPMATGQPTLTPPMDLAMGGMPSGGMGTMPPPPANMGAAPPADMMAAMPPADAGAMPPPPVDMGAVPEGMPEIPPEIIEQAMAGGAPEAGPMNEKIETILTRLDNLETKLKLITDKLDILMSEVEHEKTSNERGRIVLTALRNLLKDS